MHGIGAAWLYPLILVAGVLQAWGPPMNAALRNGLTNPWLASLNCVARGRAMRGRMPHALAPRSPAA